MVETVIRSSSLSYFPDCPRRFAARTFRSEITGAGYTLRSLVTSIGAPIGSAVHRAAAIALKEKASTGNLPPRSVTHDAAIETLREGAADGVMYDRESPSLNDAEQQTMRQADAFLFDIAPEIQPILVEERLEAAVPHSTNALVLSGQADLIAREPGAVDDLKAGKRNGWHGAQLGSYALLARSHGYDIIKASVNFVQRVAMKKPQPPAVREIYNVGDMEAEASMILHHIDRSLTVFRQGDPERHILPGDPRAFPANPNSMLCGERWCEAWGTSWCTAAAKKEDATE